MILPQIFINVPSAHIRGRNKSYQGLITSANTKN